MIGAGGMGAVYLAEHARLQRNVGLKVLHDSFAADAAARAGFAREARLLTGLDHPNIVTVYDCSAAEDPRMWLSMRYVTGGDADQLIAAQPGGMDPERAVRLITDVAHALDHAHHHNVLHRDVKPANILIEHPTGGERAVVTDFGIARALDATRTDTSIAATMAYAAPERFRRDIRLDGRADVYSLACTLFQMLTGQLPFMSRDVASMIAAHLVCL
ncbi:serine/threonine-protein kinase [Nocardia tengchongensis]|uniref:serine/threonine-protein kinase n=1 Tax=Nocardia tengchongensis TaxID=2055889 RepID=UPI0033F9982C